MIVLPMAGESSRFARAGYALPKYRLLLHGHTVFAHALGSFADYFATERFLFVCRNTPGTPDFVQSECARLGVPQHNVEVVALDAATAGQAETVAAGLRRAGVSANEPLTVFNIDTFRPGFQHPALVEGAGVDGYIEVFTGEGEAWSFVRSAATDGGKVLEVAEKRRISNLCSDGLYHFRSAALFLSLYAEAEFVDPAQLQGGERYVAPLYNIAISRGLDIRYVLVASDRIRFCGTPEEYEVLRSRPPFLPLSNADRAR